MNFFTIQSQGIGRCQGLPLLNHKVPPASRNGLLKKIIMRIQLCTLIIIVTCMQVSASAYSQTVTLNEKNAPLQTLLEKIKEQSGYNFWYNIDLLKNTKPVSVNLNHVPLNEALKYILLNQQLSYKIVDKTIVINPISKNSITILLSAPVDIAGKVTDTDGTPLQGATIRQKGTTRSVLTDKNGEFKMKQVSTDATLTISYLGYITREIRVSQGVKNIVLKADEKALNEVTVTNGYQELDPRTLTSAITSVKAKDILVPGIFSIDQALEGRVAGLFVMNNSGEIGAAPKIRIRGTSTVLGNHEPLWVVDGVVVNDPVNIDPATINDLDFVNRLGNSISGLKPFDIESIDVLKDASATALYGVRAANGVIVITTKKGHVGAPIINFSSASTYTARPRYTDHNINVMDSRQRVDYSRDLINNNMSYPANINYVGYEGALHDLYTNVISYEQFQARVSQMETMNTDWFSLINQDAFSTQNDISISGGTPKMRYFASLGAANQNGTIKGDKVNQYTAFLKLNANLTERLTWDMNFRSNVSKKNYVANSVNALDYAYNTSRAVPAYTNDGSYSYYNRYDINGYYNFNILNEIDNARDITDLSGINLTNSLGFRFSPALRGTLLFSYSLNNTNQETNYGENTYYSAVLRRSNYKVIPNAAQTLMPFGGELQSNTTRNYSYLLRPQFDYKKNLGGSNDHLLTAAIGGELSSTKYDGTETINRGFLPDRGSVFAAVDPITYPQYAVWALNNPVKKTDQLTNLISAYFTTSYTYKNRYTINFNTRTDYSNKFGASSNEKFLPSYSFSGRWDVAQDFFKNSKDVNMLAFRGSYGYQGNMLANQTPEVIMKTGGLDPVTGEYSSTIAYYPNPNLKWEKTGQVNAALDFSLFGNKLNGSFTYYHKKTVNAFVNAEVSDINGRTAYVVNSGTISNQGIEVALSFTPINNALKGGKGFTWRIDPEIGQAINSLIGSKSVNVATVNSNTYLTYLNGSMVLDGKSINSFYSYKYAGLSPVNGKPLFYNDETTNGPKLKAMTSDQVFQYVMVPSGNRIPTLQGGLSNSFSYNSFSLSFNLSYSFGSTIRLMKLYESRYGGSSSISTAAPMPENNVSTELLNRWQKPGDEAFTNIPGLLNSVDYNLSRTHWSTGQAYVYATNMWQMYDNSDLRTASGNFVKIKTWSLRYALPTEQSKKLGLKMASISLAGTNLYTFASKKLNGQDPEQAGFSSSIQLSQRPSFSLGIDISL